MITSLKKSFSWIGFGLGLCCLLIIEIFHQWIYPSLSYTTVILLQVLLILLVAYWWGTLPSLIIAAISFLQTDYFYLPPLFTFSVDSLEHILTLLVFILTAIIVGQLMRHIQKQFDKEFARDRITTALYHFTHSMTQADHIDIIYKHAIQTLSSTFHTSVFLLIPKNKSLSLAAHFPENNSISNALWGAANWAWKNKKPCGSGTNILPDIGAYFKPLQVSDDYFGLILICLTKSEEKAFFEIEQQHLFDALCAQTAHAIYRMQLEQAKKEAEILKRADKLHSILLASISHDLRTPLVSIMGSISSILEYHHKLDFPAQRHLLQTAFDESQRLNRYISNLIAMTKMESGILKLNRKWTEINDIIRNAIALICRSFPEREIETHEADNLPLVFIDPVMTEQVFVNIIENAIKYSQPDTRVTITSLLNPEAVEVRITDNGVGIAPHDLSRVFERFYRVRTANTGGYGLGLAICKSILEDEEATIVAYSPGLEKGSTFTIQFKKLKTISESDHEESSD